MGMNYSLKFYCAVAVSGLLMGCTHLEVERHTNGSSSARSGYAYMLDYTQYEIVLKRSLVDCDNNNNPSIKFEASAAPSLAPDGEQVYVIDPQSMISAFKTSDISIDYKDGRLVGLNASTVDKTGDVVGAAAVIAGKVALLSAGVAPVADGGKKNYLYCSQEAKSKLTTIRDGKKPLRDIADQLEAANERLAVLIAQYAGKPTQKLQTEISATTKAIKQAQEQSERLSKITIAAQAWLTDTTTFVWPEVSTQFTSESMHPLSRAVLDRWFDTSVILAQLQGRYAPKVMTIGNTKVLSNRSDLNGNAAQLEITDEEFAKRYPRLTVPFDIGQCPSKPDKETCAELDRLKVDLLEPNANDVRESFEDATMIAMIKLKLVRRGSYGSTEPGNGANSRKDGLRYRVPAAGWLYICEDSKPCASDSSQEQPIAKIAGAVAQMGTVFNIPFSSPAFASGNVKVTFDEQGRLLHAGLVRDSAAALVAINATGTIVDQAISVNTALDSAPLTDLERQIKLAKMRKELEDAEAALEKTPIDKLDEELQLLELQQKVEKARAVLAPSRSKDLTTQLEIAKLEAQLAETEARYAADPQADLFAVKEQYEAQTLALNARRAALEAEVAVLAAEKALTAAKKP